MKHVAFVIHGHHDSSPRPAGSYKIDSTSQKDVFVELGNLSEKKQNAAAITFTRKLTFPFSNKKWNIRTTNNGETALYDQYLYIYENASLVKQEYIPILPPGGVYVFTYKSPTGVFAQDEPNSIRIKTSGVSVSLPVSSVKTILWQVLFVIGMISIFVGLVFVFKYRRKVVQYKRRGH